MLVANKQYKISKGYIYFQEDLRVDSGIIMKTRVDREYKI